MKPTIDFKECLKDSPKFRASLESAENDIDVLEARLERLVKLCSLMIETGKSFKRASSDFVTGVRDLAAYFKDDSMMSDDTMVSNCLNKFAHEMGEMLKFFNILMDQANRSVCKNLNNFVKQDIKQVKDSQKDFEKASTELDNAINRNASIPRTKPQECEEAATMLKAKKSCFAHTAVDHVFQINILNSKKRYEILETMLSFMRAQSTFFHQGHDLFQEFEPEMKNVASQVDVLSAKASQEKKEMEERHSLVQNKDPSDVEKEGSPMEGYLLKRTSKGFKSWVRRWFSIENSQLLYMKRGSREYSIMEEDIRLCTVKLVYETDRRFCFEVLSPTRSHMLQAESDQNLQFWLNNIQTAITKAYKAMEHRSHSLDTDEPVQGNSSAPSSPNMTSTPDSQQRQPSKAQQRMDQLTAIPGNSHCCDCGSPEPRWASINLGATLCIECSGIHRSFGVHMSKVRSITLDSWDPELLKVMAELGNDNVNRIYEANLNDAVAVKATPECNRSIRESFIRAKYLDKAFVSKLPGPKSSNKVKGWSVRRKPKRSPSRDVANSHDNSEEESDLTSGIMEAVLSVSNNSGRDTDSGLGVSADVIVFGKDIENIGRSIELESSEGSDLEDGDDTTSTTSWEDMSKLDPNLLLYKAVQARNLPVMLEALANKADPNWVNQDEEGKTPLMKAVDTGSLTITEFLLLNGAKVDRKDKLGRTPLHHATIKGHTGQVCQFLKRGADLHAKDGSGQDPLEIAVSAANADIVTLLRLAKLNEDMKEDGGNPGDETFNDVFKDFTHMASENPEKLKRKDNVE
ncbi:arf-GAP with coiled-coil, ANK repeat and PH domain-containing protein 2-like isoform X2 [Saccostrea echinata]|uniref:arf-GAP with coiled-coil, ANK repeat and PH domain-containing protein 2-like isoform X2 n=1 Tax=Saccostrea echinata TaxID=191078 RepID=UPI002A8150C9|nr:arf-GAP with coiled-coil, ANK repeat and PH domain-containing protein 2-like isoform X2 [Saccostrea echinata]